MIGTNMSNQSFKSRGKFVLEDVVSENFLEMMKDTQIEEAKQIPERLNKNKFTTSHHRKPSERLLIASWEQKDNHSRSSSYTDRWLLNNH